ncbi:MAG TPA: hypothetical protein VFH06_01865 [Candidatus Saccharimonadales bacterium]|nr:hypothetical protein [Candidatus Saccharimonadales bacterium]
MNIQNDMQKLLQKEMDRKDFIKHVGIGFAAILGITTILKTISTMSGSQGKTVGYSSGVYGGSGKSDTQGPKS